MTTPMVLDAGALPGQGDEVVAASVVDHEAGKAPPTAAEDGVPPEWEGEEIVDSLAAQEAGETQPSGQECLTMCS